MTTEATPLACDLGLLSRSERDRLMALTEEVFRGVLEVRELPDGYEFGYADASGELIARLAEWIILDRKCCPFLKHGILTEPQGDHVWLHLTGPAGAKESIAADVERLLPTGGALNDISVGR